ncbi:MAG: sugar phosphate isomerase/epimerase family protein [Oscillospiraceae bacterium]
MGKLPVGVQVYSVREDAEKDFLGTVKKLKALGYDFVELAGLYGRTPQEIRAALDEAGISALSAHVPFAELTEDTEGTVAAYDTIGCKYIAIPYLEEEFRPGNPGFDKVMEAIPKIGAACNARGITLLYHNHDFEFAKMPDGRYALDYMYETIPADILQSEIDTCWVNISGVEPWNYVRKYTGRAPIVHLKDFFKEGEASNMYELIGILSGADDAPKGKFEFRPVGYGMQSIPDILAAAVDAGTKYLVVEQDMSVGRTPMEAVEMSRNYLKTLGF